MYQLSKSEALNSTKRDLTKCGVPCLTSFNVI